MEKMKKTNINLKELEKIIDVDNLAIKDAKQNIPLSNSQTPDASESKIKLIIKESLIEKINEINLLGGHLQTKLEETINQMADIFDSSNNSSTDCSNINIKDLPNAEKLHDHITGLLEGHLGRLAKEIAEETASEMNLNLTDVTSVSDVFQQLFQNPGKLMKIVKKVGTKLDDKLKSGEIKESELLKEATELMGKMGKTPGMKNMNSLFGEMGLPIGRKSKINKSAFQAHMQRQMRAAKMRERMKSKLVQRKSQQQSIKPTSQISNSWLPDSYNHEKPLRFKKKKKKKKKTKK